MFKITDESGKRFKAQMTKLLIYDVDVEFIMFLDYDKQTCC